MSRFAGRLSRRRRRLRSSTLRTAATAWLARRRAVGDVAALPSAADAEVEAVGNVADVAAAAALALLVAALLPKATATMPSTTACALTTTATTAMSRRRGL